jgi:hypothetical protein
LGCEDAVVQRADAAYDRPAVFRVRVLLTVIVRSCLLALMLAFPMGTVAAETLKEAIDRIEKETGGKVLSADTIRTRGSVVYRIKVLMPDGRIRIFQIPA